jgi:uncharacterized protein (DUF486 family)
MPQITHPALWTVVLLILANVFMTVAWYGHLKYPNAPLYLVVILSWLIAFFEYWLQVPANRIGYGYFSASELKTIQEVISLAVFVLFSFLYLGEPIRWSTIVGFAFIMLGAYFIFQK